MSKLVIFDVDNTLVEPASGETFRKGADDWKWMPGRLERLTELHQSGTLMGIASNQGGVAFGLLDSQMIRTELQRTAEEGHIAYVAMCFYHPKAKLAEYREDSTRRKPGPDMLLEIMEAAGVSAEDTLMVGDRDEDRDAAHAANCSFMWAKGYFGDEE